MKNNSFLSLDCDVGIFSQSEYEKKTGEKLNVHSENSDFKLSSSDLGNSIVDRYNLPSIDELKSDRHYKNKEIKPITILKSNVKANNAFMNEAIKISEQKAKDEARELAKIDPEFPYIARDVLTDAEKQLYHFMKENICQKEKIEIFIKVRVADLIDVNTKAVKSRDALWKITNKHVDFLVCERNTLEPLCVIELDDYTHNNDEAIQRDLFVMQSLRVCGIETARIRTKIANISKSDLEYAENLINERLAPNCPRCGLKMVTKKSMKAYNKGHRFYACPNNIDCRETIDIDLVGEDLP